MNEKDLAECMATLNAISLIHGYTPPSVQEEKKEKPIESKSLTGLVALPQSVASPKRAGEEKKEQVATDESIKVIVGQLKDFEQKQETAIQVNRKQTGLIAKIRHSSFWENLTGTITPEIKQSAAKKMIAMLGSESKGSPNKGVEKKGIIFTEQELIALKEESSKLTEIISTMEKLKCLPQTYVQQEKERKARAHAEMRRSS